MNNNLNQDNYLLNQNTQQQYLNIQSYETQPGQTQGIIDFQYSNEFQDSQRRVDFVKKMYIFLTLEFFINFLIIALGICSGMMDWLYYYNYECYQDKNNYEICTFEYGPSWLFYVSLVISILLQFLLYFGGNNLKNDLYSYLLLIPQLIFYGFTLATIGIVVSLYFDPINVVISIGIPFVIIIAQTIYFNLNIRDLSFIVCSILIICITIPMLIILSCLRELYLLECFLCILFSVFYTFYLMLETKLMMCKGTLQFYTSDSLYGSLFLNALMIQPLVRIFDIVLNACGRNRK